MKKIYILLIIFISCVSHSIFCQNEDSIGLDSDTKSNDIILGIEMYLDGKLINSVKNISVKDSGTLNIKIVPSGKLQRDLLWGMQILEDNVFIFDYNERKSNLGTYNISFNGIEEKTYLIFYAFPNHDKRDITENFMHEFNFLLRQCCYQDSVVISNQNIFVLALKISNDNFNGNNIPVENNFFRIKDDNLHNIFRKSFIDQYSIYNMFQGFRGNVPYYLVDILNDFSFELYTRRFDYLFSQNSILKDFTILFYKFDETKLNIFLFDQNGLISYDSLHIGESELFDLNNQYRQFLGVSEIMTSRVPYKIGEKNSRGFEIEKDSGYSTDKNTNIERELYNVLFPGAISKYLQQIKNLIIIPAGCMGTIPFYSLKSNNDTYLIDKFNIIIACSIKDIFNYTQSSWVTKFHNPLIVGNPIFPNDNEWFFPQLPGAEEESKIISEYLNVKPLIGTDANKDTILKLSKNADLLYFATHAIADAGNSFDKSFIVFSGDIKNYKWTYNEIQNSKLSAKLCVLSACQTGLGYIHEGGIMTLAEAFEKAGVPRVVMSLWSIDDYSTRLLMEEFIRNLAYNPPYAALRNAALFLRNNERYSNPKYWSSFMYFGYPY